MKKTTLLIYGLALLLPLLPVGNIEKNIRSTSSVQVDTVLVKGSNIVYQVLSDGTKEYVSPIIQSTFPFDTIAPAWQGDDKISLSLRLFENNTWSSWKKVIEEDFTGRDMPGGDVLFAKDGTHFQYKIELSPIKGKYPELQNLLITYIASPKGNNSSETAFAGESFAIIPRAGWQADESLQYVEEWQQARDAYCKKAPWVCTPLSDAKKEELRLKQEELLKNFPEEMRIVQTISQENGRDLFWSRKYMANVKKIVVHHTGEYISSDNDNTNSSNALTADDYQTRIRSMYYYHTIIHGWGDIGYNFIVDPLGNVYEGRAGGDRVVGAHVAWNNEGSIGIGVMGNYETMTLNPSALNGLTNALSYVAKKYSIDPVGTGSFRGKILPNIVGHKDLAATACPGKDIYNKLNQIRLMTVTKMRGENQQLGVPALGAVNTADNEYSAQYVSTDISEIEISPTTAKTVRLRFKNNGTKTWGAGTYLEGCCSFDATLDVAQSKTDRYSFGAGMEAQQVRPGEIADFLITFLSGYIEKVDLVTFTPVIDGNRKIQSVILPVSVSTPNYAYEFISSQYPKPKLVAGEKTTATITLKNTGNITWKNEGENAIVLKPDHTPWRKTDFHPEDPTVLATLAEGEVKPGEIAHFTFALTAPSVTKSYDEYFTPYIKQVGYFKDVGMHFTMTVTPREKPYVYSYTPVNQKVTMVTAREEKTIAVTLKNTDTRTWEGLQNITVTLLAYGFEGGSVSNTVTFDKNIVPPGETVTMYLQLQAPLLAGRYVLRCFPRILGSNLLDRMLEVTVFVQPAQAKAQRIGEPLFANNPRLYEQTLVTLKFKNMGNMVWKKNKIGLGKMTSREQPSVFFDTSWLTSLKPTTLQEEIVRPGETGTFSFYITPKKTGISEEAFKLGIQGCCWVDMDPVWLRVNITTGQDQPKPSETTSSSNTYGFFSSLQDATASSVYGKNIKVRLMFSPTDNVGHLSSSLAANLSSGTTGVAIPENSEVVVSLENGNIVARSNNREISGNMISFSSVSDKGIIKITNWEHYPEWDVNKQNNDNMFRQKITVINEQGKLVFINELPFEQYLQGVAETASNTHYEKKKTMAILARTYALFYLLPDNRKFPGKYYDASDDPNIFQKYLGYGYELRSQEWLKALQETKGLVVAYQGKLIKTPYFNNSDGRTRSAEEVWGWKDMPYLVSVPDTLCDEKVLRGHGVGLSGCGAEKAAQAGKKFDEIIRYYYTGVEVRKVGE